MALFKVKGPMVLSAAFVGMDTIDPIPPWFIKMSVADKRPRFIQFPKLNFGTGAFNLGWIAGPTASTAPEASDSTPTNNLGAVYHAMTVLDRLTLRRVDSAGFTLLKNMETDQIPDYVGREAVKDITIRITDTANPVDQRLFKIRIPGYNPQGLSDAQIESAVSVLTNYYKSYYSSNNTDTIEVLF